ncbi:hypothetical protein [Methylobacterium sp. CM6257]
MVPGPQRGVRDWLCLCNPGKTGPYRQPLLWVGLSKPENCFEFQMNWRGPGV